MNICGRVISGLGKGRAFISLPPYRERLEKALGGPVFLGTLNCKLSLNDWCQLYQKPGYYFPSFVYQNRRYGSVKAIPVLLEGKYPALVLFPEKGIRPAVIEIVASVYLRKELSLNDGDKICLSWNN